MIGALLLSSAIFSIAMFHLNHPAGAQADPDGPDGDHLHKLRHVLLRLSLLQLLYVHSDISFQAPRPLEALLPSEALPSQTPISSEPQKSLRVPPSLLPIFLGGQHLVQTGVAAASLLVRSFVTPRLLSLSAPNTPRHWLSEPPEKAACLALAWPGLDMIRSSIILGNVDMISVPLGKRNLA